MPDTVDVKIETENELPSDSSSQDDTWMRVDGEYTWGGGLKSPRKCFDITHTTERCACSAASFQSICSNLLPWYFTQNDDKVGSILFGAAAYFPREC